MRPWMPSGKKPPLPSLAPIVRMLIAIIGDRLYCKKVNPSEAEIFRLLVEKCGRAYVMAYGVQMPGARQCLKRA